jgi:hypothetical protein
MTPEQTVRNQEDRPKGSYRVVRCGIFDYWVQQWSGNHWAWIWPCMTKFGAVWFIVSRREMLRDEQEKETNAQTVWEE